MSNLYHRKSGLPLQSFDPQHHFPVQGSQDSVPRRQIGFCTRSRFGNTIFRTHAESAVEDPTWQNVDRPVIESINDSLSQSCFSSVPGSDPNWQTEVNVSPARPYPTSNYSHVPLSPLFSPQASKISDYSDRLSSIYGQFNDFDSYGTRTNKSLWPSSNNAFRPQDLLAVLEQPAPSSFADHDINKHGNIPPWTEISDHLPTGRKSSHLKLYWSTAEDAQLLAAVASVKEIFDFPLPWTMVADTMNGRTSSMCSKRYRQLQRQMTEQAAPLHTRGPWTSEEDDDLLATIAECQSMSRVQGLPLPWTKIGSMLKQPRSGLQVCARYTEALDQTVKRGRWTKEEDTKLLQEYMNFAGRWSLICQQITGRTQRQCASRYGVLKGKNKMRSKLKIKRLV